MSLHDNEAFGSGLDEVIDPENVRVLDDGKKLALGNSGGGSRGVLRIEQAFQDDVAREQRVESKVNPAQSSKGNGAFHGILAGNHVACFEAWNKVVLESAFSAESPLALERRVAARAETLALRHLGVQHDGAFRFDGRQIGKGDESCAQLLA